MAGGGGLGLFGGGGGGGSNLAPLIGMGPAALFGGMGGGGSQPMPMPHVQPSPLPMGGGNNPGGAQAQIQALLAGTAGRPQMPPMSPGGLIGGSSPQTSHPAPNPMLGIMGMLPFLMSQRGGM